MNSKGEGHLGIATHIGRSLGYIDGGKQEKRGNEKERKDGEGGEERRRKREERRRGKEKEKERKRNSIHFIGIQSHKYTR